MKKLLMVSLFVNVALLAGWFRLELSTVAEAGGVAGVPEEFLCYDANGDGSLDLSDPVTLLNWLFSGNATPEACPTGGAFVGLPDTGQTLCYDAEGNEVDCASDTCAGQDGFYSKGCPNDENRFVLNDSGTPDDTSDDTVTDNCTGLEWQQNTADVNGDGTIGGDRVPWCDALVYCENLSFADHDDWRLPNIRELQSIVDYGRFPAIDPVFGALSYYYYWSSTSLEDDRAGPNLAWVVHEKGGVGNVRKGFGDVYVRAVRTAQ